MREDSAAGFRGVVLCIGIGLVCWLFIIFIFGKHLP